MASWTCPNCGATLRIEHGVHKQVCRNYPGADQLRAWVEDGWPGTEIARECGVSKGLAYVWLKALGLRTAGSGRRTANHFVRNDDRPPLDLVRHLRTRGCRSCENCDDIAVCRSLDERGVWVLCEMPERDFVKRCIERGLVPTDTLEVVPAAG